MEAYLYSHDFVRLMKLPITGGEGTFRNGDVSTVIVDVDGNSEVWDPTLPIIGGNLVVMDGTSQVFAGPIVEYSRERDGGQRHITIQAECFLRYAAGMITLPTPGRALEAQDESAYYTRRDRAGELIFQLVRTHIAQGARTENRTPLRVSSSHVTSGKTVRVNTRFKNLLETIQTLADSGGVVFRTWLEKDTPRFLVEAPTDRSREIRLREQSGSLTRHELTWSAPEATRVLVAGQGEGEVRTLKAVIGDPTEWKMKDLVFQDRRDTDEIDELIEAGEDTLDELSESATITLEASAVKGMRYARDYRTGDVITVALDCGNTIVDILQTAEISWGARGEETKLSVGPDREGMSEDFMLTTVKRLQKQIRNLQAT